MVELTLASIGFVEDFEILVIVHLDECDAHTSCILLRQSEGFRVAKEILVELSGFVQILDVDRHMSDAEDLGPGGPNRFLGEQNWRGSQESRGYGQLPPTGNIEYHWVSLVPW